MSVYNFTSAKLLTDFMMFVTFFSGRFYKISEKTSRTEGPRAGQVPHDVSFSENGNESRKIGNATLELRL